MEKHSASLNGNANADGNGNLHGNGNGSGNANAVVRGNVNAVGSGNANGAGAAIHASSLAGKVAFVTGGTSGIGFGIAKALAGAGMRVAVTYRRQESLRDFERRLASLPGMTMYPVSLDVTDRAAVQRAADAIVERFGKVHVLCNSAGVNLVGPMDEATHEDWDWVMGVNFGGIVNVLVSFLPKLEAHDEIAHVINVGSMSSFIAGPQSGLYTASKFAVRGLSESLRYGLAEHGIGVSLVCPGLTRSRIYEAPLRRLPHRADTGLAANAEWRERMAGLFDKGMDPDDVGRKALEAVLRNDFYVFTHPEFRDELRELADEVLAAVPTEEPDPGRLEFEEMRRQVRRDAARLLERKRRR